MTAPSRSSTVVLLVVLLAACGGTSGNSPQRPSDVAPPSSVLPEVEISQILEDRRSDALEEAIRIGLSDLPDVEVERYIEPSEYGEIMAQCMNDAGFPATARPDGGVDFGTIDDSEAMSQREAMLICQMRFPVDPTHSLPLTSEQLRQFYDHLRQVTLPCIEGYGFSLPQPPSFDTFVSGYGRGDPWSPFTDLFESAAFIDPETEQEMLQVCSQSPWQ